MPWYGGYVQCDLLYMFPDGELCGFGLDLYLSLVVGGG